ncbi:mitogen-activated protein kinase kinase kinase 1 [Jatropha curcas]|uniref:mitogen-activated protein kinase kinase kinase 1 n=1 Tax=Jatropha curcas TaxID=180498 RepID=UPI00189615F8|nr:mitogen-activated protein kinase kinase kinase 1 [Jatropha curcas]
MLGSGSFGEVYKVMADPHGFLFAAKKVPLTDAQKVSSIEREIDLLCHLRHENIVEYFGTKRDETDLYVFLEFVNGGSIIEKVYREFPLNDSQVSYYTKEILKGLEYLHEQDVVHGDIKCANLLLNENGVVKIADFGLAKVTDLKTLRKSGRGTPAWCAPEAPEVINLKRQGWNGFQADIWSLGCTVLEMLTKNHPYYGLEPWTIWYQIGEGILPKIPETLSEDSQKFILKCLQVNPEKRPTATELLKHRFVNRS